jgi:hypothetical protein
MLFIFVIDALNFAHEVLVMKNLKGPDLISEDNPSKHYQMLSQHSTSPQFSRTPAQVCDISSLTLQPDYHVLTLEH